MNRPLPCAKVGSREVERVTDPMNQAPLPWHRRILGAKYKCHRDLAARDFFDHCLREATRLKDELVSVLRDHNPDGEIPRRLEAALGLPLLLVHGAAQPRVLHPLFDAHCLAVAHAAGRNAMRDCVDPLGASSEGVFAALEWRKLRLRQGRQVEEWP